MLLRNHTQTFFFLLSLSDLEGWNLSKTFFTIINVLFLLLVEKKSIKQSPLGTKKEIFSCSQN